jgi:hypothetical protein
MVVNISLIIGCECRAYAEICIKSMSYAATIQRWFLKVIFKLMCDLLEMCSYESLKIRIQLPV